MINSEFVEPYRKTPPPHYHGRFASDMEMQSQFSNAFGSYLHDRLTGTSTESVTKTLIPEYTVWASEGGYVHAREKLDEALLSDRNDKVALDCMQEMNFHSLNIGMINMWSMLEQDPDAPHPSRLRDITTAQDIIALSALEHLALRERAASAKNEYEYHRPENRNIRNTLNGILLEADAGIVLLEMMKKHRGLTVVPSPAQFEHAQPGKFNSDFVIVDTVHDHAVGAQVKGSVEISARRAEERGKEFYDPSRIMFIDGDADLGCRVVIKSASYRSPELISWPGMISAQHFAAIQRPKQRRGAKAPTVYQMLGEREVTRYKLSARSILGRRAIKLAPIVDRIAMRTLARI